jgi:hypothetical protein
VVTILIMGASTVLVGGLPNYAAWGLASPVILAVRVALGEEQFAVWGWRIPFLVSILLLAVSVWIRMSLSESPLFRKKPIDSYEAGGLDAAQAKASADAFGALLGKTIRAAGDPAKADPAQIDKPMAIAVLAVFLLLVTMVYGPIAAILVEMFPTRIRYTAMSLPYHIGNGWFGGFLPTTAFALVAATGDIFAGLCYPIILAAVSFVVALLFLRETKDDAINP